MLKEFKEFAFKGNVVDMAVGVIIGGAFGTIVNSLVNDDIITVFGHLSAGMVFMNLKIVHSEAVMDGTTVVKPEAAICYGSFIQNIINFLIIAFSIFMMIKVVSKGFKKKEEEAAAEAPAAPTTEELLTDIRDLLKDR